MSNKNNPKAEFWSKTYYGKKAQREKKRQVESLQPKSYLFSECKEENYNQRKRWEISKVDLELGEELSKKQQIEIKNEKAIFEAGIYCLLSAAERTTIVEKVFNLLKNQGFLDAKKLLKLLESNSAVKDPLFSEVKSDQIHKGEENVVKQRLDKTHWPNQRKERMIGFINWWISDNGQQIAKEIFDDIQNGKTRAKEFRNIIVKEVPGFSYKSASFLLNKLGYDDVLPIDLWEIRYLRDIHFAELVEPDYETKRGITDKKTYDKCERKLQEIADKLDVSLSVLHATIWGKYAQWKSK